MHSIQVLVGVIAGGLLALWAATAFAGGGVCRSPKTEGSGTEVALQEFCFKPTILSVAPGQTVTWKNWEVVPHTVTSATYIWENRELRQGDSFSVPFDTPGIYPYYCILHYYMGGAVVVGELDQQQQAFLSAFDAQQKKQQEDFLAAFEERQQERERSLLAGSWAQASPALVALVALGGGLGGAALTLAWRVFVRQGH